MNRIILLLLFSGIVFYSRIFPTHPSLDAAKPTVASDTMACLPRYATQEKARVSKVIDGDTIEVSLQGKYYRVRYIGIDTPESVAPNRPIEPLSKEAAAKNAELVSGKEVILIKDVSVTDKYGRLLRYVLSDGVFVNHELVKQGYAKVVTYPPDVACSETFLEAQRRAQNLGLGLWGHSNPSNDSSRSSSNQQNSSSAPCNCSGPDLDCGDFSSQASAQACFDYCYPKYGDIFRLDGDRDKKACERLK